MTINGRSLARRLLLPPRSAELQANPAVLHDAYLAAGA